LFPFSTSIAAVTSAKTGANAISGEDMILDVLGEGVTSNVAGDCTECPVIFSPGENDVEKGSLTLDDQSSLGVEGRDDPGVFVEVVAGVVVVVLVMSRGAAAKVVDTKPSDPKSIE
jgi:hypothetical protein